MKTGIIKTVDILDDVLKSVQELAARQVLVGIPSETAGRDDGPINSAAIAYIQETGDPAHNLPARPFLVPTILRIRGDMAKRARATIDQVTQGKPNPQSIVDKGLSGMGILASQAVKATINAGDFAPLAASTIYARRHRKPPRMSDKPLVDTGQMRNAMTYVIRSKAK